MTLERFADICLANPYRRKGMFYSEVYLFLKRCEAHDIQVIIESGVKFGMSTALLRAGFSGHLVSIDKDGSARRLENVDFMLGDSRKIIPTILAGSAAGQRVAVLIDGPKGSSAVALMWDAMCWANVRLVGIHDLPRAYHIGDTAESFHSHDPQFRREAGDRLDDLIQHDYRRKYPDGPGLGIWEKKP